MISVLLPYRNAATTIAAALASVQTDLAPTDEILAIDDGSTDASAATVRALAATDPRVRLIASGGSATEPAGVARSLARGLSVARGALIARMDADDVSRPGRFAKQRARLEGDPTLAVVATQVALSGDVTDGMARYVGWQNTVVSPDAHRRAIFIESPLCHPSVLMRRDALEAVGGYTAPPWPEDWDLWLRLHAAGHRIAKLREVLFVWHRHAATTTAHDARCEPSALRRARAHYLARELERRGRAFAVWGAGPTGRRLARELERHGARPQLFVDIDPRKVGRTARGRPIVTPAVGLATIARTGGVVVCAVGSRGARETIHTVIREHAFDETHVIDAA